MFICAKKINQKGVLLFITLGTLLIAVVLSDVILRLILSESRFTRHEVSRIQAYYAALAGMNLALEELRLSSLAGGWGNGTYTLCNSAPCDVIDSSIPYRVDIKISDCTTECVGRRIDVTATYTYPTSP